MAAAAKGETDAAKRLDRLPGRSRRRSWPTRRGRRSDTRSGTRSISKRVGGFSIHPVWQYDVRSLYVKPGS